MLILILISCFAFLSGCLPNRKTKGNHAQWLDATTNVLDLHSFLNSFIHTSQLATRTTISIINIFKTSEFAASSYYIISYYTQSNPGYDIIQ